ncbi:MAG: preprotein translocase subunit SecG [Candidatus Dadabacteria bacterium]|nr:MAG: preprotein translocase subunit SecG [Candidatus Dadabacteria bacterium]
MFYVVFTIHCILCVILIGLVLIQQGKGADMGATLGGGGSDTLFGATGATSFITKVTTGVAIAFMFTSVVLVRSYYLVRNQGAVSVDVLKGSVMEGVSEQAAETQQVAPDAQGTAAPNAAKPKTAEKNRQTAGTSAAKEDNKAAENKAASEK